MADVGQVGRHLHGHLAHHGQDRPLGRLAHRAVRLIGRPRHRGGDQDRVDELARAARELLGGAADQLREDHARVAARAQQRRAGDRRDDLVAPHGVDRVALRCAGEPVELLQHGAQRQHHVVARVAVGDREHIEIVDLLAARLELGEAGLDNGPEPDDARVGQAPTLQFSRGCAHYRALATLPAFRQRVHTYTRRGVPPSSIRTRCRFGSKRRLVATIEWLRLWPNAGPFAQTWQTLGMAHEYKLSVGH